MIFLSGLKLRLYVWISDRNECVESHSVCRHGDCVNIPGGYECVCHHGFTTTLNGRMCTGEDVLMFICLEICRGLSVCSIPLQMTTSVHDSRVGMAPV